MALNSMNNGKSSADLEREVDAQRSKVEARIGEIRDRMSPGQLLDEALSYTKHGGAHFATNLGQQVAANPLPAALTGIGIAWLIASNASGSRPASAVAEPAWRNTEEDFPYARVRGGGLKRVRHQADDAGKWWSEFQSDTGETYRAQADELGRRAGHFTDEAGKRFAGFIDEAGNKVRQFQDESGNRLDEGLGWASHSWQEAQRGIGEAMHNAASSVNAIGTRVSDSARQMSQGVGGSVQSQADQLSRQITTLFNEQPLIAGALAFAAGAAIGATLPHTQQEDDIVGEQADKVRQKATDAAANLYEQGKEQVAQVYDDARKTGSEIYETTKNTLSTDTPLRH